MTTAHETPTDYERLVRTIDQLVRSIVHDGGFGAAAVIAGARRLLVLVELYVQDRRRRGAEVLRQEPSPP